MTSSNTRTHLFAARPASQTAKLSFSLLGLASLLALSGCYPEQRYQRPSVATAPAYKENAPSLPPVDGWKQAAPNDAMLRGKWWEIFADPELNHLEEKLAIDNQNVAQYFQNYMVARAQVAQIRSSYWPTVTVGAAGSRTRTPAMTSTTTAKGIAATTNSFSLPLSISWEPDFFGKIRSQVAEYTAAAQVSAADLENERLSEQSSLAQYYFELRGQDALQQLYDETTDAYKKVLELTQSLVRAGIDTDEDVASAEASLHAAEADAVAIRTTRAQYEHAIALLVGEPAGSFSLPARPLDAKVPVIPTGLPSQLLERRPDIAAAERTMAENNALIGVARAAYYPTISISAGGGTKSSTITNLFNWDNRYWSLAPTITETVFDGGSRKAVSAEYLAQYNASVAAYRQTVLSAFKEVEDYLVANRQLAEEIGKQEMAVKASTTYRNLALSRYTNGLDTYLTVLTAENSLLSNQRTLATLRSQQMTAAVELVAALGGGWDSSQLPTAEQIRAKKTSAK